MRLPVSKETLSFLTLTALALLVLFRFVNLEPQVDDKFFFSSDDPQFQSEKMISRLFPRTDSQIIISAKGDIFSTGYLHRVEQLSQALLTIPQVTSLKSLAYGPNGVQEALKSPLWRRLLISEDQRSSNLIVMVDETSPKDYIPLVEEIARTFSTEDFQVQISGFPYIAELIRRYLLHDLRMFTLIALVSFGIVISLIFRSRIILTGTIISALMTCVLTLVLTDLLQIRIGILTANLATIVFVLTISHIVFLTNNWQHIEDSDPKSAVNKAVRWTFHASFWCMVTTLLGFLSLLLVPAKPLRELGISGALGTLVAIMSAYGVYPSFLRLVSTQNHQKPGLQRSGFGPSSFALFNRYEKIFVFLLIGLCVISVPGLRKIKTDPSLLSYFSPKSEIHQGLLYIDRNGGSSPAIIVLRASNGEKLNSSRAYQQLWDLQTDLERHPAVGTIVSLPVIMAEAKRAPFAFFLSWEWLLNILEQPNFGRIANSFVTQDRQYGLFLLRMKETGRKTSRLDVVEELKDIVSLHGFVPELSGGVYILQGRLAQLVASSLVYGLGNLLLIFTVIGLIISRSIKLTLAITASVGAIALSILGTMGNLKIPFDVIAAPAANIAIGMGIDSMIHSVMNFRRFRKESQNNTAAWLKTRQHLWKAILGSMLIIAMGFGIFCFSTFPPTQRFGAAVVYGTVIAALTAIFFMPFLTNLGLRKK